MLWFPCLVVLLSCVSTNTAEDIHPQCKTSKMKLVLKCHHDERGTWQSTVSLKHDAKDTNGNNNPPWIVDVIQATHACEKGQSTLETIIYLEAPGVPTTHSKTQVSVQPHAAAKPHVVIPVVTQSRMIPNGYELFPGIGYYKFHHDVVRWADARDRCAHEGGHLVIINSEAERLVVKKLFADRNPESSGSSNKDQIHTGIRRLANGKHATIFDVALEDTGFSTWYANQPSGGASEPCVSIMRQDITLNDISCEKQILAYICEVGL